MALIDISHLTFCYDNGYDNIFEDASFQIDSDWKLGFIGRNGKGKTTFFKLLLGLYEYSGTISSPLEFEYFPYEVHDKSQMTKNILQEIIPTCEDWQISRELSLLTVSEDVLNRPFQTLSNGEQTKVLLAALFLKENRFLLIDEPTNHLDEAARESVSRYLNGKRGFILVSHDRAFLDGCIDHVLSINRAEIEVQKGNFSSWQKNKQQRDHWELMENEKLKKEIRSLTEAARRTSDWSDKVEKTKKGEQPKHSCGLRPDRGFVGHKAAKMMKRSKNIESRRENAVTEKSELLKNLEDAEPLLIKTLPYQGGNLVEANNLSLFYGNREVSSQIQFKIRVGDRVAVTGKNGSGKSTLLKLILGESIDHTGFFHLGSRLTVSYVPQDTSFLKGNLKEFAWQEKIDEPLLKAILRKLDFSRVQFEKDMSEFSGGQKKKVLLAKSLCQPANLYIWDEPLNFIDVISRMQVEDLLLEHKPTMIFVEHDRTFLEKVATKTIYLQ